MRNARTALLALGAAFAGHAAVLRGTVVEAQTGKALARTLVAVHPVAGTAGSTEAVRTDTNGVFAFRSLAAGTYVVSAARKGLAPIQYGQKAWKSAGTPVAVQDSEETVLRIPMPRFGAIVGRISDEDDVGMVEQEVIAYRNTRPPAMVAKAATDDRGMYRIFGLEPGSYLVRTAAKKYEDGAEYLPTFYKETAVVDGAYPVDVQIDRDTPDVNIRPTPGRLYSAGGQVVGPGTPPQTWTVLLLSDMGYQMATTDRNGRFYFTGVAPGRYEFLAQSPHGAAWQPVEIDRDRGDIRLTGGAIPQVEFAFENDKGGAVDAAALQLWARRRELAGPGAVQYLALAGNRAELMPGRWEFSLAPNPSYYVRGWAQASITSSVPAPLVRLTLFANPGAVHGTVTAPSGGPAGGAPVYLEHGGDTRSSRTDIRGAWSFVGLEPGEYRVTSTFEGAQGAQTVSVEEGRDVAVDLKLGGDLLK